MQYESPILSGKKVMAKIKVFSKVGQTSRSRLRGQKPELSERQHSSPAATICKYCIQEKFCPRFIFALFSEGEFKTG